MTAQYDPDFSADELVQIENEEAKIHQRYWNELSVFGEADRDHSADDQIPAPTENPAIRRPRALLRELHCYAAELVAIEANRYKQSEFLDLWLIELCERAFAGIWDRVGQIENLTYHSSEDSMRSAIWQSLEETKNRCRQGLPPVSEPIKRRVRTSTSVSTTGRRRLVNEFIAKVQSETGRTIRRSDIWKAAGYTDRTEFERFQRHDKRSTPSATQNFVRVLGMSSASFIQTLDKVRSPK